MPALSLHWLYLADFGLRLIFREARAELGRVELSWPGSVAEPVAPLLVRRLSKMGVLDSFEPLPELACSVASGACSPRAVRDRAAELLGLPAYEWLSPRYCRDTSLEETQRLFPDAEDLESP